MAPNSHLILFTFLSIVVVALPVFAASQGDALGGYVPINDLNDPKVVKVAEFAVTEHNKEANSSLKFKKVVSGEYQIVSGTNYRLVIATTDGRRYKVVVYEKLSQNGLQLISFEEIKIIGGYKPIPDPKAPEVVKAGKFAVTKHNNGTASLIFKYVVSGEQQLVAGMNYRLVIAATDGGFYKAYKALVYKNLKNILQLLSFEEIKF